MSIDVASLGLEKQVLIGEADRLTERIGACESIGLILYLP
jgi:hypothetical protein